MRFFPVMATALVGLLMARSGSAQDPKQEVVGVVEGMFAALARGDTAAMRGFFHPEGRVVQTGTRDGAAFNRVNSIDSFLRSIGGAAGRKLEEKIFDPSVQIEDNLAVVWSKYQFLVDGKASHCGVDSYQLVRTPAGWKLLHIVDTQKAC
jgi:hypothetical protein